MFLACSLDVYFWRYICLHFLEFKLNTKEGTTKERTHSFMFIKFIKKNKKTVNLKMRKNK